MHVCMYMVHTLFCKYFKFYIHCTTPNSTKRKILRFDSDRHGKLFIEEDTKLSIEEQPARTEVI